LRPFWPNKAAKEFRPRSRRAEAYSSYFSGFIFVKNTQTNPVAAAGVLSGSVGLVAGEYRIALALSGIARSSVKFQRFRPERIRFCFLGGRIAVGPAP
jgi:hypothetical protein